MIKIIPYETKYQSTFKSINEQWIKTYFEMEESDYKALDNPQEYILNAGGHIFIALLDNIAVGSCALIKMDNDCYDYELAKMAVTPEAQGKKIGFLLGQTALDKAKKLGAKKVYLESNTKLKPAIALYRKLGFKEITGYSSPYQRCDIQMECVL